MIYVRGNKLDYDYWAAQGNTGWSYDEVLPYFLKSEDNRNPYLVKTPYHKEGGYLTVQVSTQQTCKKKKKPFVCGVLTIRFLDHI